MQPPTQATRLSTWDAQHYLFLATEGYHAGQRSITFFPLFPWLIRLAAALPGIGPLAARSSSPTRSRSRRWSCSTSFLEQRHPGSRRRLAPAPARVPRRSLLSFPVYREPVPLPRGRRGASAVARERWLLAAVPAFLLSLTRPNGVLIGLLLLYAAVTHWRRERRISLGPTDRARRARPRLRHLSAVHARRHRQRFRRLRHAGRLQRRPLARQLPATALGPARAGRRAHACTECSTPSSTAWCSDSWW